MKYRLCEYKNKIKSVISSNDVVNIICEYISLIIISNNNIRILIPYKLLIFSPVLEMYFTLGTTKIPVGSKTLISVIKYLTYHCENPVPENNC